MKSNAFRTIWLKDKETVEVIDQRVLPHRLETVALKTVDEVVDAIKKMIVRGAPLIAATAGYGVYLALLEKQKNNLDDKFIKSAFEKLSASRPTAVNLFWALDRMKKVVFAETDTKKQIEKALLEANNIIEDDVETCRMIGIHGLPIIEEIWNKNGHKPVQILTHCNAGMLGCIEWGTITSPIYQAKAKGIDVHVWVDETRPRGQGSNLTAFELTKHNIPHTLIVDNTGGHLMQHGMVDLVLVGTDRTTREGDVANKIGTYLKALAAHDNKIPFYVALPSTSIDWTIRNGLKEIPIEERDENEVKNVFGKLPSGELASVLICPETTKAANYGFDVTPARLVTKLITERGVCEANETGLLNLFPEKK
ncbi:MAG: S-methyl-5-thioribose-1-phosphate isomerase [Crocinitomicaceae bacterium]